MRFRIYGKNKSSFYKSDRWEKRGGEYVRVKRHTQDDVLSIRAMIKDVKVKASPEDEDDPDKKEVFIFGVANANVVDRMDERLDPRGLDMSDFLRNPVLLAYHDHQRPVGKVRELDIQEDGIYFTAKVGYPEKGRLTEDQKEIRNLVDQGILRAVSVGFIPKRIKAPEFSDDGEMTSELVIEDWEMLELSIVSVPANQASLFDVKNCESSKKGVIVEPDTSKKSFDNQTWDKDMLKKLKALRAMLLKSKNLTDVEINEEDGQAKLTFVLDDIKSVEDLLSHLQEQKSPEDDAMDSKEGMEEAISMLRGIDNDLKANTKMTEEIRAMMDEDGKGGYDSEDDKPEDDEEDKGTDDSDSKSTDGSSTKDFDARLKTLEDSQKDFQETVKGELKQIGEILSHLVNPDSE